MLDPCKCFPWHCQTAHACGYWHVRWWCGCAYLVCLPDLGHPGHHGNFLVGRYRGLCKQGFYGYCFGRPLPQPPQAAGCGRGGMPLALTVAPMDDFVAAPPRSSAQGIAELDQQTTVLTILVNTLTVVLVLGCCAPCGIQLLPSCCFRANRRRAKPNLDTVPLAPQFSVAWLSAALRRSAWQAGRTRSSASRSIFMQCKG